MLDNYPESSKIIRLVTTQGLIDRLLLTWQKNLDLLRKEKEGVENDNAPINSGDKACVLAGLDLSISLLEANIADFEYFIDVTSKAGKIAEKVTDTLEKNRMNGNN